MLMGSLLKRVSQDGCEDAGEFVGLLVEVAEVLFEGFAGRGLCEQTEPEAAFARFFFRDPDAENEVGFGDGVVGLDIIRGDGAGRTQYLIDVGPLLTSPLDSRNTNTNLQSELVRPLLQVICLSLIFHPIV